MTIKPDKYNSVACELWKEIEENRKVLRLDQIILDTNNESKSLLDQFSIDSPFIKVLVNKVNKEYGITKNNEDKYLTAYDWAIRQAYDKVSIENYFKENHISRKLKSKRRY